jgi:tetratricopeptide (TPR) repeat protein
MDSPKLKTIFTEALVRQEGPERAAYLDEAWRGDPELRAQVEALLRDHERIGRFLGTAMGAIDSPVETTGRRSGDPQSLDSAEAKAPGTCSAAPVEPGAEVSGTVIGPYKLLQVIGEGGMGTVYMAEQTQPVRRTVALKLIKAGMDSRQVLARFGTERQALALMDHPNIAKVFDAGTTDSGRPYFVMELVKGIPISRFCDERRLTTRERLELAIPVCQAVQHAHQKGIIHRDIKPSNVLIALYDGQPVPKVIDFGVAKATGSRLTDQTLCTEFGAVVGTLEYMSPEQAELNQLDIDTRSDIYSLGVLLYELLTGSTPLDRNRLKGAAILEMLRVIREEESPRPSLRLSTTEELPNIAACRNIEPRKLSGLVRGELDWIVMKALEKDRNRRYETANSLAADLRRYLDDEPVHACPPSAWYRFGKFARRNEAGLIMAAVLLLAVTVATAALGWTVRDRAARRTIVEQQAVLALDDSQACLDRGAWPEALSSVRRAQGILAGGGSPRLVQRIAQRRADLELVARLEEIRLERAAVKEGFNFDNEGAAADYTAALRDNGLPVTDLPIDEAARRVASSPIRPFLLAALDDWAKFVPADRTKLMTIALQADDDPWRRRCRDALLREDRPALLRLARQPDALAQAPGTVVLLGTILNGFDKPTALEFLVEAQQRHPGDLWINYQVAWILLEVPPRGTEKVIGFLRAALAIRPTSPMIRSNLGSALRDTGQLDAAIAEYRAAIRLKPDLAEVHANLGAALNDQGKVDEALAAYREAIRLNPNLAETHSNLGIALRKKGELNAAIAEYREAIRLKPDLAEAHNCLGNALQEKGELEAAIAEHRQAIRLQPTLVQTHNSLGNALTEKGELDEAVAEHREAIRLQPDYALAHNNLGIALRKKRQLDEAIVEYREAIRLQPTLALAHNNLGNALREKGELEAAIAACREAIRLQPDYAKAHDNLGIILNHSGRLNAAIAEHREAIRLQPDLAEAHDNLGNALQEKGELEAAIAEHRQAIRLQPTLALAHINLGIALREKGELEAALAACREAIRLQPDLAEAHVELGVILCDDKREYAAAIKAFRDAIRVKPGLAIAHHNLGVALLKNGLLDAAIGEFREAIRLQPGLSKACYSLGHALVDQGKLDEAIAEFRELLERDPKNLSGWRSRAYAYRLAGRFREARADLEHALTLAQDDPALNHDLAWLLANALKPGDRDPKRAVQLATRLVERAPTHGGSWITLGAACYRAGDWKAAVEALTRSIEVRKGGDSADWFFLAMAHWQLGNEPQSRSWYDGAVRWMEKNQPKDEELLRFRAEAAALLGVSETKH